MKVIFLNTSERTGGAAVAAGRLRQALNRMGVQVDLLVREDTWLNRFRFYWERLVIFLCNHFNRKNLFTVSIANTGVDVSNHPLVREADIIHLHWINQGFLSLKDIKALVQLGKPIVWTMHDMWPVTGICHYAWECRCFYETCGKCLFLKSSQQKDLSHRVWKRKSFLRNSGIHLVAVSSWLAEQAKISSLTSNLEITVVPNVIDVSVFTTKEKKLVRDKYSFPLDKKIILMGAARLDDPIKGFQFLKKALNTLLQEREDLLLILFGAIKQEKSFFEQLNIPYISLGLLSDNNRIADLYSAADVTVVPSFYETFGQTLIEAMACGCPVVSFNNSGQMDIIDHKQNGYLANYKDADDLAAGIRWVLDYPDREALSKVCVEKVKRCYSEKVVAEQYKALYEQLLDNAK